jgi:iron-sulfur cluster repair protein YtfE (RIC family)
MSDEVDMTMMLAIHDALRRDLENIARSAAAAGDDPARLHATHFGWELFKTFLTFHHRSEDDFLWPRMRELVAGRPDDLALLDAMEAEHSRIDPLIEAVEGAFDDPDHGPNRLADIADALTLEVGGHLRHEEQEALPLIGREISPEDWLKFGEEQRNRVGMAAAPKYLPWLLDGAAAERVGGVLAFIPPHLHEVYRTVWQPQYRSQNPWSSVPEHA